MKVVFFYGKQPQSFLCRLFTGSGCYHVGFTDGVKLWDMNLLRRRRVWDDYAAGQHVTVDTPVPVTVSFLESRLEKDGSVYGWRDYIASGLRRLGIKLRNFPGRICSEQVADDLKQLGWVPPPWFPEVPTPADLELALLGRLNAIKGGQA